MKEEIENSDLLRVSSVRQAAYLRNVQNVQILRNFMTPEGLTVGTLAQRLGWPPVRAYREVRKLEELHLLEVLRVEPRAGKPLKIYHCPYRQFFLPLKLLSVEEFLRDSFQPYETQIRNELALAVQDGPDGVAGFTVGIHGEGIGFLPTTRSGEVWFPEGPGHPAVHFSIGPLYLDYEQAVALQQELQLLFEKYGQFGGAGRYLHHVILTPDTSGKTRLERSR